jgi:hypothetical protein
MRPPVKSRRRCSRSRRSRLGRPQQRTASLGLREQRCHRRLEVRTSAGPRLASAFAGFDELTATSMAALMEFGRAALVGSPAEPPVTGQATAEWLPLPREAVAQRVSPRGTITGTQTTTTPSNRPARGDERSAELGRIVNGGRGRGSEEAIGGLCDSLRRAAVARCACPRAPQQTGLSRLTSPERHAWTR